MTEIENPFGGPENPFETPPPPKRDPRRSAGYWLKKPWVIVLIGLVVMGAVLGLSINQLMQALLHSQPEVQVPNLEGKTLMDALGVASKLNLSIVQDGTEFDESLPAGTIVRQQPPSGMQVRQGRSIRVVVSKGGQVLFVPEVVGKPIEEAQSVLAGERLQMGAVSDIYSTGTARGIVLSQSPSSGTVVTRGAFIDIGVSKGAPPAGAPLIPDFKGKTSDTVQQWADNAGSNVDVTEDPKAVGEPGTVLKQDPAPNQPVVDGQKIRITIVPLLSAGQGTRYTYEVPQDQTEEVTVRIMARDNRGESKIYEGKQKPGSKIEIPLGVTTTTRIRVYLNDVLKEEKVVEP